MRERALSSRSIQNWHAINHTLHESVRLHVSCIYQKPKTKPLPSRAAAAGFYTPAPSWSSRHPHSADRRSTLKGKDMRDRGIESIELVPANNSGAEDNSFVFRDMPMTIILIPFVGYALEGPPSLCKDESETTLIARALASCVETRAGDVQFTRWSIEHSRLISTALNLHKPRQHRD